MKRKGRNLSRKKRKREKNITLVEVLIVLANAYHFIWCLQIPYVGLNFAVYESLKDWLVKTKPFGLVDNSELGVVTRLACGAAAGTVGQTVAYPLDVIRRRMQMVGWSHAASIVTGDGRSKAPLEYTGMIDAFRKTVKYEGVRALYKGLVPNSVKVSLVFQYYYLPAKFLGTLHL